uniref:Ig-like domain-containing protein n=1 Tax=Denticeps clupeoides TaxID=299321 RepID=A0AAY3ZT31_9TELE
MEQRGNEFTLKINQAQKSDNGVYSCLVKSQNENVKCSAQVLVQDKLMVSRPCMDVKGYGGKDVILTCEVNRVNATAEWMKDDQLLAESRDVVMEQRGKEFILKIKQAQKSDNGVYSCLVKSQNENVKCSAQVLVQDKLMVSRPCMDVKVYGGQDVILTCEVNRVDATAEWTKDGQLLAESRDVVMEQQGNKFTLKMKRVQKSDDGLYTCLVKSDNEEVKCSAEVSVQEKLMVSRPCVDVKVYGEQDVILTCEVNREDARAEWTKDGQLLAEGGNIIMEQRGNEFTLKIKQAQKSDNGIYFCLVKSQNENVKCSAQVLVQDKLMVSRPCMDVKGYGGQDVILTCEVNRVDSTAEWTKDDQLLAEGGNIIMEQQGNEFTLRIKQAQMSDNGVYSCLVKSQNENVKCSAQVLVQDKLMVSRPCMDVKGYGGQDVILTCEVNRVDATAEWMKDDQLLAESRDVVMEQQGNKFTLKIKRVQKSDDGLYTCLVKSDNEEVKSSAEVSVQEFEKEWRSLKLEIDAKEEMQTELCQFKPKVEPLRILLYGPAGSGKSSFITSVANIFKRRLTSEALADAVCAGTSFTRKHTTHKIEVSGNSEILPFVFNDVMGLEGEESKGVHPDDIINILKGHIKENYEFQKFPLGDEDKFYNRSPSLSDKVHCLVCVLPADQISFIRADVTKKMREIRERASEMGIPQVVMVTKLDCACPVVNSDLRKIYHSMTIKEKMQECSNKLGVTMNYIFPVKNYHEEKDLVLEIDVLILDALLKTVHLANDFLNKNKQNKNVFSYFPWFSQTA